MIREPAAIGRAGTSGARVTVEDLALGEAQTVFASAQDSFGTHLERWTPFHEPAILALWEQILGAGDDCRIVVAWDAAGDVAAYAPFMRVRGRVGPMPVPTLRFIGNNIGYPGDILYSEVFTTTQDAEAVSAVLAHVATTWSVRKWEFGYLSPASLTWKAASEVLGDGFVSSTIVAPIPFASVSLPTEWDAYFASLTSNTRSSYRRGRRRLETQGALRIVVADTPEDTRTRVEELIRNHGRWLAATEKQRWFGDDAVRNFLVSSAKLLASEGEFIASALELNGEPIAWIVGPAVGRRCFLHLTSYDRRYSKESPGLVLGLELMRVLISKGYRRVDLGPGSSLLKKRLGGVDEPHAQAYGYQGWARSVNSARGLFPRKS